MIMQYLTSGGDLKSDFPELFISGGRWFQGRREGIVEWRAGLTCCINTGESCDFDSFI